MISTQIWNMPASHSGKAITLFEAEPDGRLGHEPQEEETYTIVCPTWRYPVPFAFHQSPLLRWLDSRLCGNDAEKAITAVRLSL